MVHYHARYRRVRGGYSGIGWIEALPARASREDLMTKLSRVPAFDPRDRQLPYERRRDLIDQISDFYRPFSAVFDLTDAVYSLMTRGYSQRPFPAWETGRPSDPEILDSDYHTALPTAETTIPSLGMVVIGPSGTGKTTGTHAALSPIPQVIRHGSYRGRQVQQIQITYIKITCPGDSSPKSLCKNILREIDRVAGTKFYSALVKSRTTQDDLIDSIPDVCRAVGLGLLVLDELQHLSPKTGGGGERIMNHLVSLSDSANIPILYIGTHKAERLIGKEFRHRRRACSFGAMDWRTLDRNTDFVDFVRALWPYQYIRRPTAEPDKDMLDAFYTHTQGIADLIVKLFMLSQAIAILEADGSNDERLTPGILGQTARECLGPIQPILAALRTGHLDHRVKVDDMVPLDFARSIEAAEEGRGIRVLIDHAAKRAEDASPIRPPESLKAADSNPPKQPTQSAKKRSTSTSKRGRRR